MSDMGLFKDKNINNINNINNYDDFEDNLEPLNINQEYKKIERNFGKDLYMQKNYAEADKRYPKQLKLDIPFIQHKENLFAGERQEKASAKLAKFRNKDSNDVSLDINNVSLTTLHDEYKDSFEDKKLFKSRSSKVMNKKSRLYTKARRAAKLKDYDKKYEKPQIPKEMTLDAVNDEMTSLTERLMGIKLKGADVKLMDDDYITANAKMFEDNIELVEKFKAFDKKYPDFREGLDLYVSQKLETQLERIENINNFYKIRKLIILNPYYRNHYNEELSMNVGENDSEDKKLLAKLLRTSYYLGKNLQKFAFKYDNAGRGMVPSKEEKKGSNNVLTQTLAPGSEYMAKEESKICQVSRFSEDYVNVINPEIDKLQKQYDSLLKRKEQKEKTTEKDNRGRIVSFGTPVHPEKEFAYIIKKLSYKEADLKIILRSPEEYRKLLEREPEKHPALSDKGLETIRNTQQLYRQQENREVVEEINELKADLKEKRDELMGKKTYLAKTDELLNELWEEQDRQVNKRWTVSLDLTKEERETYSFKYRNTIKNELYTMAVADLNSKKVTSAKMKLALNMIKNMYDPDLQDDKKALNDGAELNKFIRIFNEDMQAMRDSKPEDFKNTDFYRKYISADGKYKMTEEEIDLLSSYIPVILSEQRGNLDVTGKNVIDATNDDAIPKLEEKSKPGSPLYAGGEQYESRKLFFDASKSRIKSQPLFPFEPSTKDITQGDLGNCYMLTSLNSIVEHDPNLIKDAMVDEGDTVVVRFFSLNDGNPVYVRVTKSILKWEYSKKDEEGNPKTVWRNYGSQGALWTKIIEKAYSQVREQISTPKDAAEMREKKQKEGFGGYDILEDGRPGDFIYQLTGKKSTKIKLKGTRNRTDGEYHDLNTVLKNLQKKAEVDFGEYDYFKEHDLFNKYDEYLKNLIKKFESGKTSFGKSEQFFFTVADWDFFLNNIKLEEIPDVEGIDNATLKKKYVDYLRQAGRASGLFKNTVKITGDYTDYEKDIYSRLEEAVTYNEKNKKNKKIVTAATGKPVLELKDKKNALEMFHQGIADSHGYSVLGVKKEGKHRFVILSNPWVNNKVRMYDEFGYPYMAKDDTKVNGENLEANGIFKMELKDFINTFRDFSITD